MTNTSLIVAMDLSPVTLSANRDALVALQSTPRTWMMYLDVSNLARFTATSRLCVTLSNGQRHEWIQIRECQATPIDGVRNEPSVLHLRIQEDEKTVGLDAGWQCNYAVQEVLTAGGTLIGPRVRIRIRTLIRIHLTISFPIPPNSWPPRAIQALRI